MNGYKVMVVRQALGLPVAGTSSTVDRPMMDAVSEFQRSNGLDIDGIVGPVTWAAMGFRPGDWHAYDSYVAPLRTDPSMDRALIIEEFIAEVSRYIGSPYVWGGANHPDHGADCSGMVLEAMYAVGLDPVSIDTVKHALPAYRTTRELFAHPDLLHVPVSERQRGDLLFYSSDGTAGRIYHIAIDLGDGTMIEETEPEGRISTVRSTNLVSEAVRLFP
ncbi:MAG TPA: hypothetical protein GX743_10350 [Actinomycetales bacterium]|nr:hypothetical protein [Actinomycetales bacterium]